MSQQCTKRIQGIVEKNILLLMLMIRKAKNSMVLLVFVTHSSSPGCGSRPICSRVVSNPYITKVNRAKISTNSSKVTYNGTKLRQLYAKCPLYFQHNKRITKSKALIRHQQLTHLVTMYRRFAIAVVTFSAQLTFCSKQSPERKKKIS